MKRIALVSVVVLLSLFIPRYALASHVRSVLGETTTPQNLAFPAVTYGPGFFLPDSPLYFLDTWMQGIKLVLAGGDEKRATLRAIIAGERLAELRIMMSRGDTKGIKTALNELQNQATLAARDLREAHAKNGEVVKTARILNETFKNQQHVLTSLVMQSSGSLKYQLKATQETVREAKMRVEDNLPENELAREIEESLNQQLTEDLLATSTSAQRLISEITLLQSLLSDAAKKHESKREQALLFAIESKNQALRVEQEQLLQAEKNKQETLFSLTQEQLVALNTMVADATETAEKIDDMRRKAGSISELPLTAFLTPSPALRAVASTSSRAGTPSATVTPRN